MGTNTHERLRAAREAGRLDREAATQMELAIGAFEEHGVQIERAAHFVADDTAAIRAQVSEWIGDPQIDVVITSGGTGLTGRDVTPEAITPLFDKVIDGFSVIFHQVSYQSVGLSTLQSRAVAGLANGTFVFCLPGSNGAVKDGWDKVIAAQLDSRHGPCNMVDLMPRLMER